MIDAATRLVLTAGLVYSYRFPFSTSVILDQGRIAWIGDDGGLSGQLLDSDVIIDCEGALCRLPTGWRTPRAAAQGSGRAMEPISAPLRSPANACLRGPGWTHPTRRGRTPCEQSLCRGPPADRSHSLVGAGKLRCAVRVWVVFRVRNPMAVAAKWRLFRTRRVIGASSRLVRIPACVCGNASTSKSKYLTSGSARGQPMFEPAPRRYRTCVRTHSFQL